MIRGIVGAVCQLIWTEASTGASITAGASRAIEAGGDNNTLVPLEPLSMDTSPEIERRQIEAWRRMSPVEKAAIVSGLTQAAYDLALAGVRARYPDASPREQFLRLAIVTLGRDLASKAYPEVAILDLR
jgi:hypothetical protein